MPLDTGYPVRITDPLDALNDSVGSTRGNAQILARLLNRLVVGAVYDRLRVFSKGGEVASGLECGRVNGIFFWFRPFFRHEVPLPMGRGSAGFHFKVLNQSPTQIDIQELAAIANGQYRLFFGKSVLENRTIRLLPGGVGGSRHSAVHRAVGLRVDVSWAAGEHKSVHCWNEAVPFFSVLERKNHAFSARLLDGSEVILRFAVLTGGFSLLFVGAGAPRNADAGSLPRAMVGVSEGHRTWNRSIPPGRAATARQSWLKVQPSKREVILRLTTFLPTC